MGYDIHITRRANWYDEEGPEITLQEWKAIVLSDPDLKSLDEETAEMWGPLTPWGRGARCFYLCCGNIVVKKPNKEVLIKMFSIAETLNARVIGEWDETYGRNGTPDRLTEFTPGDNW